MFRNQDEHFRVFEHASQTVIDILGLENRD